MYTQQVQHIHKRQHLLVHIKNSYYRVQTEQFSYILAELHFTFLSLPSMVIAFLIILEKIRILAGKNPITPSGS
jgi:hypothetical protein